MAVSAVLFADKDGTLIEDLPYNVDPERIRLAPGVRAGLRRLGEAGYGVAVVTNQSGVARGYFTLDDLERVREHLASTFAELGCSLAGFYVCPHFPEGVNEFASECDCRKPSAGLLTQAASELGVDLSKAWFIGDTWMDVVAGRTAGCRTILVGPDRSQLPSWGPERHPDHATSDFGQAVDVVLGGAP